MSKLLEAGADPNGSNNVGYTVLMKAAQGGADKVVSALIKAGADPRAKNDEGQTAMNFAKTNRIRTIVTKAMERAEEAAAAEESAPKEGATESEGGIESEGAAAVEGTAEAAAEEGAALAQEDSEPTRKMSAMDSVAASKKALLEASMARQEAAEAAREANLDIKKKQLEASMLEAQKVTFKMNFLKFQ